MVIHKQHVEACLYLKCSKHIQGLWLRVHIVVVCSLAFGPCLLQAQGPAPLVTQYTVTDVGLDPRKILAMVTLPGGTIALGTEDGVWQFDGTQFSPLWQRDDYNVTALVVTEAADLFLGGRGKLGVLRQTGGGYVYNDLTSTLENRQKNFTTVDRMLVHKGRVYAYCAQYIFAFDAKTYKLLFVLTAGKLAFTGFAWNKQKVFVNLAGQGLYEVQSGQFVPAVAARSLGEMRIRFSAEVPGGKGMLLGCENMRTGNRQLVQYDPAKKSVRLFTSTTQPLWAVRGLADGLLLPNGKVAVATENRGILLLDANTCRTLTVLDSTSGLANENIHAMTPAADGGLWLSSDAGPCYVATSLPVQALRLPLTAQPLAMGEEADYMYMSTQAGVYALPKTQWNSTASITGSEGAGGFTGEVENEIIDKLQKRERLAGRAPTNMPLGLEKVKGIEGLSTNGFIAYNGGILVPTLRGLYQITGSTATAIALEKYAVQHVVVSAKPDRLVALAGADVVVLQQVNKKWVERNRIEVSKGANLMHGVQQPGQPNILFVASSKGVYRLEWKGAELEGSPSVSQAILPVRNKSGGIQFITLADSVYAVAPGAAYTCVSGNWVPALTLKPYTNGTTLQAFTLGREALIKSNDWIYKFSSTSGQMKVDTCFTMLALPEAANWVVKLVGDNVWAAAVMQGRLILYQFPWHLSPPRQLQLKPKLTATVQDAPLPMGERTDIPATQSEIVVRMHLPLYTHPSGLLYQYRLKEVQQSWSRPRHEKQVTIEMLQPGDYTLDTRAFTYYGASPVASWSFTVPMPWYATYWAYALYATGVIVLFVGAVRYRSFALERQKRLLADEVTLKTQELQLAKGDLEVKNELLTQNSAQLQERLQIINERDKALEAYNKRLVQTTEEIEEKNRILQVQKEQLELANHAIQESQEQLIKQERDAAIGRLVAQVAHEINSPIGAIKGTAQGLLTSLPLTMRQVPTLLRTQPEAVSECFINILSIALEHEENYSTREERKLRGQYEEAMTAVGLQTYASEYADVMVKLGPLGDVTPHLPLLRAPNALQLLEAAISIVKIGRSARKIRDAVESTQRIVVNLKLTAYHETSDQMQEYDLPETIDRILTLYNYNVKQGIVLEKQYQQVPILWGYPHELGQVWNNLISNAVHATQNKGKIEIQVAQTEPGWVTVTFKDNGPGIPHDVVNKIFDQFFTTKGRGEGTGLGLFISKRIIEKHGGTLLVNSRVGETQFTARLPILPAPVSPIKQKLEA